MEIKDLPSFSLTGERSQLLTNSSGAPQATVSENIIFQKAPLPFYGASLQIATNSGKTSVQHQDFSLKESAQSSAVSHDDSVITLEQLKAKTEEATLDATERMKDFHAGFIELAKSAYAATAELVLGLPSSNHAATLTRFRKACDNYDHTLVATMAAYGEQLRTEQDQLRLTRSLQKAAPITSENKQDVSHVTAGERSSLLARSRNGTYGALHDSV